MNQLRSGRFVVYRGHKLKLQREGPAGRLVVLVDDPSVAAALGFEESNVASYVGSVVTAEVEAMFWEGWYGLLDGVKVFIDLEEGDHYSILTEDASIGRRWNLSRLDQIDWQGSVPRSAITKIWSERKPI